MYSPQKTPIFSLKLCKNRRNPPFFHLKPQNSAILTNKTNPIYGITTIQSNNTIKFN